MRFGSPCAWTRARSATGINWSMAQLKMADRRIASAHFGQKCFRGHAAIHDPNAPRVAILCFAGVGTKLKKQGRNARTYRSSRRRCWS